MRRASGSVALASVVSFLAQLLLGLATMRLFAPYAAGEFAVMSQVAFFWTVVALAQSPLKLLADVHLAPATALRSAFRESVIRLTFLLPIAGIGLALSGMTSLWRALLWVSALAFLQLCWYLAQSVTLRVGSARSVGWVRATPPLAALLILVVIGVVRRGTGAEGLAFAAAMGYALGAMWLVAPGMRRVDAVRGRTPTGTAQADDRGARLRLVHTVADGLVGAGLLLIWRSSHGAEDAGYFAILLRLLGFVSGLISSAWAQVMLVHGAARRCGSLVVGLVGAVTTCALAVAAGLAIQMGWFDARWNGMGAYLLPVALWQAAACLPSAFAHLAFIRRKAVLYSKLAISFDAMQLVALCVPVALDVYVQPVVHLWMVAGLSAGGLIALAVWLAHLPNQS